jgi:hypothetical protein
MAAGSSGKKVCNCAATTHLRLLRAYSITLSRIALHWPTPGELNTTGQTFGCTLLLSQVPPKHATQVKQPITQPACHALDDAPSCMNHPHTICFTIATYLPCLHITRPRSMPSLAVSGSS